MLSDFCLTLLVTTVDYPTFLRIAILKIFRSKVPLSAGGNYFKFLLINPKEVKQSSFSELFFKNNCEFNSDADNAADIEKP